MIRLRPKEWSIRLHLFAFAATILVPLILLGSYFATEFAERERERYQEVAKALAADIAADVDRELDSTIAALQALSTSPALRNGDLEAFDRQARETLHYRGSAIAVRDQTGQQIINTYAPWGTPLPVSTHPVLRKTDQTALETQRPVVSDLYQGAVAKALYVLVDVPVTIRGEARYVLNIALTPERIRRILASSNLPRTGSWQWWTAATASSPVPAIMNGCSGSIPSAVLLHLRRLAPPFGRGSMPKGCRFSQPPNAPVCRHGASRPLCR
ncbi:hypothetical protein ACFQY9_28855 [Microvirga aerilata]|uniref:hypothetical protein n=1 Tax=Microvirga aerilata TaxID=670292 RepID=UPI003629DFC9